MTVELKNSHLPVLGWRETSEFSFYEQLAEGVQYGLSIICNTHKNLNENELCAFIFYSEYSKRTIYKVFSGTVEELGIFPNHLAPSAYRFHPEKEIKISSIGNCPNCGDPEVVILESKKL
jgi:hypothetical protein